MCAIINTFNKNCFLEKLNAFIHNAKSSISLEGRSFHTGHPRFDNCKYYQRISDAYAGKSLFLTGGTGFLGKVLIERLLYNCEDIKNIYVLVRPKRGLTTEQRLEEMFSLPIFMKLKKIRPQDLNKVISVNGDLMKPDLGIRAHDLNMIEENVSMVFHLGASVKFKESLKNIIDMNCGGTKQVMGLSKRIKKLETFVYFSTAFSSPIRRVLDEVIYPPIVSLDILKGIQMRNDCYTDKFKNIPPYIVSKSLAETMVYEERGNLRIVMIRPSAVTATIRDPIEGWVDSWIAVPSFFTDHSRGLFSVARGYEEVVCDLIPCDYVCNLAIVAAARGNRTKEILIYNSCTSSTSPLTWQEACDVFLRETKEKKEWELPPRKMVLVTSPVIAYILILIRDRIPAFLADMYLWIKGEKPRFVNMQNRSFFIRDSVERITRKSLFIKSTRTQELSRTLDKEDQDRFPFDTNAIDWAEYIPKLQKNIFNRLLHKRKR